MTTDSQHEEPWQLRAEIGQASRLMLNMCKRSARADGVSISDITDIRLPIPLLEYRSSSPSRIQDIVGLSQLRDPSDPPYPYPNCNFPVSKPDPAAESPRGIFPTAPQP